MSSYEEYAAHMALLTKPSPLPENMPVFYAAALGRPIRYIALIESENAGDGALHISFEGGGKLVIFDEARSCCENRYMTTDDDLPSFIGAKVLSMEAVAGPDIPYSDEDDTDIHEQTFVKLETTKGTITMVTHNEHNGYYGGFDVVSRWEDEHGRYS